MQPVQLCMMSKETYMTDVSECEHSVRWLAEKNKLALWPHRNHYIYNNTSLSDDPLSFLSHACLICFPARLQQ